MLSNLHASLLWQHDMGADELIASAAMNRLQRDPEQAPAQVANISIAPKAAAAPSEDVNSAYAEAESLAMAVGSIEELHRAVDNFEGCALKATANKTVFADGCVDSDIMLIGEAPGEDEDRKGIAFCGASGQLLDKMLSSINLSRQKNCYITNTLFWRPPANRTPSADELLVCSPFVKKHIALFEPKLLILVGGTAAKYILNTEQGVTRLRGKPHTYHDELRHVDIPVRVLFHPSYLLRQPLHKRLAWQDLLEIQALL